MSEKDKQALQQEIAKLESQVSTIQESLDSIKETLQHLKDIAWNKESKKESNKMYKVLENEKPSTIVRSNVGNVVVDREFMEKEISKHLDNPALRGMVTTEEMLSYPKVARNVKAEFNEEYQGYTWKAKANDESVIAYGSREYVKESKDINRLLTAHSKTEREQRQADRVSSAIYFNDPDFRGSAISEIIPQNKDSAAQNSLQNPTTNKKKVFSKNPQPTPESRSKLQAKMSAVANQDKESKHTKTKGEHDNGRD